MYATSVLLAIVYIYSATTCLAGEFKPPPRTSILSKKPYRLRSVDARQTISYNKRRNNNLFQGLIQINRISGQSYLLILKNGGGYSSKEIRWRPPFTYEKPTHPELVKLRTTYDLDDVAGNGDEISKIKRLLAWAHNIIPYEGNRSIPSRRNAMSIITASQKNKCGFDCRGLATILNEAYLAMGFESRLLTCLPKDTSDREHHVIIMVYSKTMNKWLWIDPSNNAYLTDEEGQLLSVSEVRERLIKEKNMLLNADANLNGQSITIKQYVYSYMTKNLFWFQSPLHSGFDTETPKANKQVNYVALFPTSFTPYGVEDIPIKDGKAYMTTNSDYFWQKPRVSSVSTPMPAKKQRKR